MSPPELSWFDIANLSSVWAMFDTFEVDLPFLNRGDQVHFTLQALPGKTYTGRIAFIDPIINPSARTARVRVEVPNSHMELKPEMYATAEVSAPLQGYKDRITVPANCCSLDRQTFHRLCQATGHLHSDLPDA